MTRLLAALGSAALVAAGAAMALGLGASPNAAAYGAARSAAALAPGTSPNEAAPVAAAPAASAPASQIPNTPYDGRFTFVRLRYDTGRGFGRGFGRGRRGDPPWAHDYPRAERHLMKILDEVTLIEPYLDAGNIFALDDPELTRFPVAYMSEPGFWTLDEKETLGLRDYLLKGGFLIVDDFAGRDWYNFEDKLKRVLPDALILPLDASHQIFNSFFAIERLPERHPLYGVETAYLGVYQDNDPAKRLMVIVNYNNDIGEYWEYSETGYLPIDLTNDAYKLGVNYIVYSMTH